MPLLSKFPIEIRLIQSSDAFKIMTNVTTGELFKLKLVNCLMFVPVATMQVKLYTTIQTKFDTLKTIRVQYRQDFLY